MSDSEKKDRSISNWWFVLLIAVCILLWVIGLWGTHEYVNSKYVVKEPQDILINPGVFGDSSGAINALFSALAFAGVIFAIILQKKELQLQREELKQTREELEGQKHEFEQQNETLKRQRFENTFFNMLSLQQDIVKGLSYEYKSGNTRISINDREVFYSFLLKRPLYVIIDSNVSLESSSLFNALRKEVIIKEKNEYGEISITQFTKSQQQKNIDEFKIYELYLLTSYLDHYFRHLYRIIKFVNETTLLPDSFEDRYQYTSMVRAQLSKYELVWLFYNCLLDNGKDKFKPLIEKYALLKNLRFDLLAKQEHKDLYTSSAYKKIPPQ